MSLKDTAGGAPPIKGEKTIIIDEIEYAYLITQLEKEEGVQIKLFEVNPVKNITFTYQATSEQISKKIKALVICESIEEILSSLQDILDSGKITIENKDEKYFMKIEITLLNKLSKYELELEKHEEPINPTDLLLNKLKDLEKK